MDLPKNVVRPTESDWSDHYAPVERYGSRLLRFLPSSRLGVGAHVEEVLPGHRPCPLHHHLREEEHFFMVDGELVVRELPDGGAEYREFPLCAGELIAYPAGTRLAHQFINRSDRPARFLAVSNIERGDICFYPDSGKWALRALPEVGIFEGRDWPGDGDADPPDTESLLAEAQANAAKRPTDVLGLDARPDHVVGPNRIDEHELLDGDHRFFGMPLAREAGAKSVFVNRDRLPAGSRTHLHWHAVEEEYLLVLEGRPTLRQVAGRRVEFRRPLFDVPEESRCILQPGDLVHWSPEEVLAHQLQNETDSDVVVIMVGDSRPDDVCVIPDLGLLWAPLLEAAGVLAPTSYWAGE